MNTVSKKSATGKELSPELRNVLMSIGRGLGTVSVYGTEHPSVNQIVEQAFNELQQNLKTRSSITLGSNNGNLTVDDEAVLVREIPIRTLAARLTAMKVSHLAVRSGLTKEELKRLLIALCSQTDSKMKEALSSGGMKHVQLENVKYVTLRAGEMKTGQGDGDSKELPSAQINQIVAFLKGEPTGEPDSANLKKLISEPEKLGQMILEAAKIRQKTTSVEQGESLADIVVGCLRRTYDSLTKETEFESAQGKASLTKTMLLVEKTIIDRIRGPEGAESPGLDRQIQAGIRDMGRERQLDMLSTYYAEQCSKREKTEQSICELIKQLGSAKAREKLMASDVPAQDWQRLITQSKNASKPAAADAGSGGGVDITAIATVLDKLDGLLQLAEKAPVEAKVAVMDARQGINDYTAQAESQISQMESKVQENKGQKRDKLILEISKLTLSLMQPLTVINGSLEAALGTADPDLHKDLLELAHESGQSLDAMTKRMIELTNYPELNEADGHLNEWKQP